MDLEDVRTTVPAVPGSGIGRSRSLPLLMSRYAVHRLLVPALDNGFWLAWDLHLRQRVTIRAIDDASGTDPAVFDSAAKKLDALRALARDGVARLIDTGVDQNGLFFVFEHLDTPTLYDTVTREGPMTWEQLAPLAHQLLMTMRVAHDLDVIHGRLAPWRCAVTTHSKTSSIRLLELAGTMAARTIVRAERRRLDDLMPASVATMAPELLRGSPPDVRTDVYGVGLLLYFALTGKILFVEGNTKPQDVMTRAIAEPPVAIRHWGPRGHLPEGVEQAILWSLAKDPRHRFGDLNELARVLNLETAPTTSVRASNSDLRARVERARPNAAQNETSPPSQTNQAEAEAEAEAKTLPLDAPLAHQLARAPEPSPTPHPPSSSSSLADSTDRSVRDTAATPKASRPANFANPAPSPARLPEFPGRSLTPDALIPPPSPERSTPSTQTLMVGSNEFVVRLADMREAAERTGSRQHRVTKIYETVELAPGSVPPAPTHQLRGPVAHPPSPIVDVPSTAPIRHAPLPFVQARPTEGYGGRMVPWPKGHRTMIEPDLEPAHRSRTWGVIFAMVLLAVCIAIPAVLVARNGGLGFFDDGRTVVRHRRAGLPFSESEPSGARSGAEEAIQGTELPGKITVFTPARPKPKSDAESVGLAAEDADGRSFEGPRAVADPETEGGPREAATGSSFPSLDSAKPKTKLERSRSKKESSAFPETVELSDGEETTLSRAIRRCLANTQKRDVRAALVHFSPTTGRPVRIDLGYPPKRDPAVESCGLDALGSSFKRRPQPAGEIARVEL